MKQSDMNHLLGWIRWEIDQAIALMIGPWLVHEKRQDAKKHADRAPSDSHKMSHRHCQHMGNPDSQYHNTNARNYQNHMRHVRLRREHKPVIADTTLAAGFLPIETRSFPLNPALHYRGERSYRDGFMLTSRLPKPDQAQPFRWPFPPDGRTEEAPAQESHPQADALLFLQQVTARGPQADCGSERVHLRRVHRHVQRDDRRGQVRTGRGRTGSAVELRRAAAKICRCQSQPNKRGNTATPIVASSSERDAPLIALPRDRQDYGGYPGRSKRCWCANDAQAEQEGRE